MEQKIFKFNEFLSHINESREGRILTPEEKKKILDTFLKCEKDEDGDDIEYYLIYDDYYGNYYLTNYDDEYDGPHEEVETSGTLKEIYNYIIEYDNIDVLKRIIIGEVDHSELYDKFLYDYHILLNQPDFEQNKKNFKKSKYLIVISTYNYYMYVITMEMYETLDDNDYFIMSGFDDLQSLILYMKNGSLSDYEYGDYAHYKKIFG